jgi:hypothetical protein
MIALAAVIFAGGGATGWGVAVMHRPPPPMFGEPPTPRVNDMVSRLREELLLSDDQAAKVKEIYHQRNEALQAIREKMGPQMKAQYDKLNEQMKGVLNPAQFQRWHERFEDLRSRMLPPPPPGGPRGPGGPGDDFPPRPIDGGPHHGPPHDGPPHDGPPHDGPPGGPPDGMPPL